MTPPRTRSMSPSRTPTPNNTTANGVATTTAAASAVGIASMSPHRVAEMNDTRMSIPLFGQLYFLIY